MSTALIWTLSSWKFAALASPSRTAEAFFVYTDSMVGTCWVNAVNFFTVVSLKPCRAHTASFNTRAMSTTCRVYALATWHITFSSFPATVAYAGAFGILSITTAQNWTCRFCTVCAMKSRKAVTNPRYTFAISITISRTVLHRV